MQKNRGFQKLYLAAYKAGGTPYQWVLNPAVFGTTHPLVLCCLPCTYLEVVRKSTPRENGSKWGRTEVQRLHAIVEDKDQVEGPQSERYDANFLRGYFSDDIE